MSGDGREAGRANQLIYVFTGIEVTDNLLEGFAQDLEA